MHIPKLSSNNNNKTFSLFWLLKTAHFQSPNLQFSTLYLVSGLPLPEEQPGTAWELPKSKILNYVPERIISHKPRPILLPSFLLRYILLQAPNCQFISAYAYLCLIYRHWCFDVFIISVSRFQISASPRYPLLHSYGDQRFKDKIRKNSSHLLKSHTSTTNFPK